MTLDALRALCLSFPGTTEGIKWEDHICFMVAEKLFCVTSEAGGASFQVTAGEFDEMLERDGIVPTPYMARNKWVTVQHYNKLKANEWEHYITQSYQLKRVKLLKRVQNSL